MAGYEGDLLKQRLEFSEHKRALLQKRLSQSNVEEDLTLWSFVDLITLMLILFILFYSHAITHKASATNKSSITSQRSEAQTFRGQETPAPSDSVGNYAYEPQSNVRKTEAQRPDKSLEKLRQQFLQTVSSKDKNEFSIRWDQKRLVLVLGERIAFNEGEADLLSDFLPALKGIAALISSQRGCKATVAGHTDDAPINTARFPSNWELSAIRAVNVAKFLIGQGVDPHRVSIEGYSAYRPLQPNTSVQNQQANRRVEITLIKE